MKVIKRPSVMVADGFEDTREMLKRWLEIQRYRVVEAVNGQEVLDLTQGECPDLILMSLRMSVLDGLSAARRIRVELGECQVPIVAMSTYPTKEEQATALAAGCNWFIAQPIDFDTLSELLNSLLSAPASH
jgi:CheY-like chemotaxis protein